VLTTNLFSKFRIDKNIDCLDVQLSGQSYMKICIEASKQDTHSKDGKG
jgi:hypothetical protein